jgi:tripartite-type tricarboxylate transporter receptor subunit TctC
MKRRDFLTLAGAAGIASLPPRRSQAAEPWPSGNITLVVPFTPGGTTDILARVVGEKLSAAVGKPVIIENRPGAGGTVGASGVARAEPDGHTLMVGHIGTLAVNPSLYPNMGYDPLKSFAYIAPLALVPNLLVVNPTVPVNSVQELIDYARANPGKLNYGSGGNGSAAHIAMAAFNVAAKTNMVHVPYRGTAPSVSDLLGGRVQLTMTGTPAVLQFVQINQLRGLGVSTLKRIRVAPQVPAIAETLPDFEASQWYGVVAPAGTPEPVVQRLYAEIRGIMKLPEVQKRLDTEGAEHWDISPDQFREHVAKEIPRWREVILAAKVQADPQ